MKTLAWLTGLLLLVHASHAEDLRFTFALPEFEGRVSLGVFDSSGKLVRVLCEQAEESSFTAGLDGLVALWDGKTDSGEKAPSGTYSAHGYFVGHDVKSEGIAFHFNDWVESEESPAVSVQDVIWSRGEELFLLGAKSAPKMTEVALQFSPPNRMTFLQVLPDKTGLLGSDGRQVVFYSNDDGPYFFLTLSPAGPVQEFGKGWEKSPVGLWQGKLYLTQGAWEKKTLAVADLPPIQPPKSLEGPVNIQLLDASDAGLVVSDRKAVWVRKHSLFEPVPLEEPLSIRALSAGVGQTFWIVAQTDVAGIKGPMLVRQYSFGGELLRQLTDAFNAEGIFADKAEDVIYLQSSGEEIGVTIRGLRPLPGSKPASDGGAVEWELFLDKSSANCPMFGLVNGKLVANAGQLPQKEKIGVTLEKSSFLPEGGKLTLRAQEHGDAVWLTDERGIPVYPVSTLREANRSILGSGKDGSVTVYVGNGAVVAEYEVTGLSQIAPIDAGDADLP